MYYHITYSKITNKFKLQAAMKGRSHPCHLPPGGFRKTELGGKCAFK